MTFDQPLGQADLWADVPPIEASCGIKLGPVDLSFDVSPSGGIKWPGVVLHQVHLSFGNPLGQADIWACEPPVEVSRGTNWGQLT